MNDAAIVLMFIAAVCFPFVFALGAFGVWFIGEQFQWWR